MQDLVLDPAIRNWVLGPLTLIMLLSGLIRHYITQLLNSPPKKLSLKLIKEQRALTRGQLLRANGNHLPPSTFASFKSHLAESYTSGRYLSKPAPAEGEPPFTPSNPLMEPGGMDGMIDMIKKQAVGFLPQTILMYYIGYFFNGFILTRLPFPLTARFKSMLQRGIETPDLDVSWVSSVSWYFLCLFGLNSVYRLILGVENAADGGKDMAAMNAMSGAMMAPGAQAPDYFKLYTAEKENLDITQYTWISENVEQRLLDKLGDGRKGRRL